MLSKRVQGFTAPKTDDVLLEAAERLLTLTK